MPHADPERDRAYKREWVRKWRKANPDGDRAAREKFRKLHPKYRSEYAKEWRKRNRDKERARQNSHEARERIQKWIEAHPEQYRAIRKRYDDKISATLPIHYCRKQVARYTTLAPSDIPVALAELWKANLKLKRLCRNQQT